MPRYFYTAYDERGARTSGSIDTETREAALEALFRQGRYPLALDEGGAGAAVPWWQREVFARRGLSRRNLALLTRELATLVKAELPVDEALRIAGMQPLMPARARQLVAATYARVREGASLSEAFGAERGAFPEFYTRIVHAGEAAGTLGQALDELAGFLERSGEFRARVASALLYPVLLLIAAAVAVTVIMTVLVPTIAPLFKDAGAEPPLVLRSLISLQETLAAHWLAVLVAAVAVVAGVFALARHPRWRLARDRALLRMPLISGLVQNGQTAIMARTLATLIRSGVPMLPALRVTGSVLANRAMSDAVQRCADEVKEGATLVGPLTRSGVFPDLSLRLIGVGEQTGQLETMLARVADIYDAALQRQLMRVTGLLTPVLTLIIGLMVGGLLLSVMGAIVSINDLALG